MEPMVPQPFAAVQPAWEWTVRHLFRPFRLERWLVLGFLCFLQTCAGIGFGGGSVGFQVPTPPFGGPSGSAQRDSEAPAPASPAEELREVEDWLRRHLGLIVAVAVAGALSVLALIVLFQWLGSRAVFCYLDALLTGRDEVARPWREHAALAASFFRARLLLALAAVAGALGIVVPIVLIVIGVVRRQVESGGMREMLPILIAIPAVLLWVAVLVAFLVACGLVDLFLYDFVAPLQYLRRTCCCAALPFFGQVILQPLHAFHRLLPLHFLRQFGREFDLLAQS